MTRSLVLLLLLMFAGSDSFAQPSAADHSSTTNLLSILDTDGSLRLHPGRSGSFDPRGLRMRLAADGSPRFLSDTSGWDGRFGSAPAKIQIYAVKVKGDDVYLGGRFEMIDTVRARNIIRWNRTSRRWYPLGDGIGGVVLEMLLQGNDLYVGGAFDTAGARPAGSIARWDIGAGEWHPLGAGISGNHLSEVAALAFVHDRLYVGGFFLSAGGRAVRSLAAWDPDADAWVDGFGGVDGDVHAMTTGGGSLYVGGQFSRISGSIAARNLARFDGTTWHTVGTTGTDAIVYSIAWRPGAVVIGGEFSLVDGVEAEHVAEWNGVAWRRLGEGTRGAPYALVTIGPGIYAMTLGSDYTSRTLHYYDTATGLWSGGSLDLEGQVFELEAVGDTLVIAGDIAALDTGRVAVHVGYLAGGRLRPLVGRMTNSVNGLVTAVAVHGTDLFVGGTFTIAGDIRARNIARWSSIDGSWHALGSGVDSSVYALLSSGDSLFVGGTFDTAGGGPARRVALWDLSRARWTSMDTGIGTRVRAFARLGSELYAAGYDSILSAIRPMSTPGVVSRWNGSRWERVGNATFDRGVKALTVDGGDLYIAGDFMRLGADTSIRYAARWNGSQWNAVGPTIPATPTTGIDIRAIAVYDGDVYIGGFFPILFPGQTKGAGLIRWMSGEQIWDLIDTAGVNSVVALLATEEGVYVGGALDSIGSSTISGIALIDGRELVPLGAGISGQSRYSGHAPYGAGGRGYVTSLARNGRDLYAGGAFERAGDEPSYNVAHWSEPARLVRASALPTEIDFGFVEEFDSTSRAFTISNSVGSNSFLRGSVDSLAGIYTVISGAGPFTLGPGSSREVIIRFAPVTSGFFIDTLAVTHNASVGSDGDVLLMGHTGFTGVEADHGAGSVLSLTSAPNPARDRLRIGYALARQGDVRITIVDALGRVIERLVDRPEASGAHSVEWNLAGVPVGIYHALMDAGDSRVVTSIVVVR